jgi:hypothetical protein
VTVSLYSSIYYLCSPDMRKRRSLFPLIRRLHMVTHFVFAILATSGVLVVAWLPPLHTVNTHQLKMPSNIHFKPGMAIESSSTSKCASLCCSRRITASDDNSMGALSSSFSNSLRSVLVTTAFLTVSCWCISIPLIPALDSNHLVNVAANAKEMASGSGSRVNKDPESLLRYGLPIDSKEVSCDVGALCNPIVLYSTY